MMKFLQDSLILNITKYSNQLINKQFTTLIKKVSFYTYSEATNPYNWSPSSIISSQKSKFSGITNNSLKDSKFWD
jgi:hypothetical protein